ncbi:hypothetical protein Rs2_35662 [Raphanus sativus]|nr:hypothetical protein Rs2_35662 [Raphanus sativus]
MSLFPILETGPTSRDPSASSWEETFSVSSRWGPSASATGLGDREEEFIEPRVSDLTLLSTGDSRVFLGESSDIINLAEEKKGEKGKRRLPVKEREEIFEEGSRREKVLREVEKK